MKILVIELSNIGDAILTYPALRSLWDAYPQAEFHIMASPRSGALFLGEPRVARVWVWEKKEPLFHQVALLWRLALCRFDLVVDFRHSLIPLFLGARRTSLIRSPHRDGLRHRAQEYLALLKGLGIPLSPDPSPLPYGAHEEAQVREWLKLSHTSQSRIVLMAPGARSHLKRWPADRFAAVADRLIEEKKAQVFFVGDKEDQLVADSVQAALRYADSVTNLTGRTTLQELAALLAQATLLITNDSACLHAADAMGIPTVAIFGPTDEKKYGPRNSHSIVVRKRLVCAPCEKALCAYHHECMNWLGVDEVHSAAVKILSAVRPKSFG